jgi:hypothetical protein
MSGAVLRRSTALLFALVLASVAACGDDGGSDPAPGDEAQRTVSGGEEVGPAEEGVDGVVAFRIDSTSHTEDDLAYEPSPPAGGEHFPVPATCGFYPSDPPPDELLVHSIEHGSVWIAYDPDLDDAQLDGLRSLVAEQAKVVATPHPDLTSPLVVTAWARQLELDGIDDPRLMQFIETYRNADTAPEPAAPCQGVGEPEVVAPA